MLLADAPLPHAPVVAHANSAPRLDASAATTTSVGSSLRCARRPRPTARTSAVSPHNLAGLEIAVGFEGRQTARFHPFRQPLFSRHFGTCSLSYHRQKRLRPHRQGHVAIPATRAALDRRQTHSRLSPKPSAPQLRTCARASVAPEPIWSHRHGDQVARKGGGRGVGWTVRCCASRPR
jgi:hypothetical protein